MFDKGKPIAGCKARYIDDDIRANNEAIEAAVGFGHDFATGSTQTGEHNDGAAKIYAGDTAPTTKEDGITVLNADDVGKRLWLDTSVTPNVLKVLTAIGTPNTWTSIAQLMGMLDEDDMASDSDELPATQQSIKTYVDTLVNGLDAENIKKDGSVAFTGNQSMGSNQLTDLPDPSSDNDAARKKYVDGKIDAMLVVAHDYTLLHGSSGDYTTTLSTRSVSVTKGKQYLILVSGSTGTSSNKPQIALFVDGTLKADIEIGAYKDHNQTGKGFFLQNIYTATSTGSINVQIKANAAVSLYSAQVLVIQIK